MNKKVLTLCAGMLLAGSATAFAQTFAKETTDDAHKEKVFHVYVNDGGVADKSMSLLAEKQEDGSYYVDNSAENLKKAEYMWSIGVVFQPNSNTIVGYQLKNAKSGNTFSVKSEDGKITYSTFIDPSGDNADDQMVFVEGTNGGYWLNVIPEPSTYATIFGFIALGFAMFRRRK